MATRRAVIKAGLGMGGTALFLAGGLRPRQADQATAADVSPQTRAYTWRPAFGSSATPSPAPNGARILSAGPFQTSTPFDAIGSLWTTPIDLAEVRVSVDGQSWTPWQRVSTDDYESLGRARDGKIHGDLVCGSGWRYVEARVTIAAGAAIPDLEFVLIDASEGPLVTAPPSLSSPASPDSIDPPYVVSRAGWGCNESYGYRNGVDLWPPEYRTVQTVIVHHTATPNGESDQAARVRSIYYYHAVSLGWGDIGYNWLVDVNGVAYEGRRGGPNVVGGHALQYNYGSTGISCIGTFGNASGAIQPPSVMKQTLSRLIAYKYGNLDPYGSSHLVDKTAANICGHRDVLQTACPGDYLYSYLPGLRGDVAWGIQQYGAAATDSAEIRGVSFSPAVLPMGSALRVEVTVANTGGTTLKTQGPTSGFTYHEGQSYRSLGYGEVDGAWRVAVGCQNNSTGVDHPYRWGLPGSLAPGQTTTVVGYIVLSERQSGSFWAGLVNEKRQWSTDNVGTTLVKVLYPGCFITPSPVTSSPRSGNHEILLPLIHGLDCD